MIIFDEESGRSDYRSWLRRLIDSTNVAVPMLTGITTIGLDHTEILGDTIEEIAAQKAGIIKQGVPVVTGNIAPEAFTVIQQTAKAKMHRFMYTGKIIK